MKNTKTLLTLTLSVILLAVMSLAAFAADYEEPTDGELNGGHIIYSGWDDVIDRSFELDVGEEAEDIVLGTGSTVYNPRLAYFLSHIARSAYTEQDLVGNYNELGIEILCHNDFSGEDPLASYYIGQRTLDNGSRMVFITIRGIHNNTQWITGFTLGTALTTRGWHEGFLRCSNEVYDALISQLGGEIQTENVIYVITGHSLGAAVSNCLAVRLSEEGVPKYNVYDYNFAGPDVANDFGWAWNVNHEHDNMFNIGHCQDPVTFIPGTALNAVSPLWLQWGKYGRSVWFRDGWEDAKSLGVDANTHYPLYCVDYLAQGKPFSEYRDYSFVHNAVFGNRLDSTKTVLYIQCPMDATVYSSDGTPIAGVIGGKAEYYGSSQNEVTIRTDGDDKYIFLPRNGEYTVSLTAYDSGELSYTVLTVDPLSGENYGGRRFTGIELIAGSSFRGTISENPDKTKLFESESGDEIKGEGIFPTLPAVTGDIDGDGELTNADLVSVARYIIGLCDEYMSEKTEAVADMEYNGAVNNADLVIMARIIVGL